MKVCDKWVLRTETCRFIPRLRRAVVCGSARDTVQLLQDDARALVILYRASLLVSLQAPRTGKFLNAHLNFHRRATVWEALPFFADAIHCSPLALLPRLQEFSTHPGR